VFLVAFTDQLIKIRLLKVWEWGKSKVIKDEQLDRAHLFEPFGMSPIAKTGLNPVKARYQKWKAK
jgi:hypothetical protein